MNANRHNDQNEMRQPAWHQQTSKQQMDENETRDVGDDSGQEPDEQDDQTLINDILAQVQHLEPHNGLWLQVIEVLRHEMQVNPPFAAALATVFRAPRGLHDAQNVQNATATAELQATTPLPAPNEPSERRTPRLDPHEVAAKIIEGPGALERYLAGQEIPALRLLIQARQLDPGRYMASRRSAAELAAFIAERLMARQQERNTFLPSESSES